MDRAKGRLLVLVNPKASRAATTLGPALGALSLAGCNLDIRQTGDRQALCDLIRGAGGSADAIVIAGGDGTINGALPALIDVAKPLGIIPCGTANDLALTLAIPADPSEAAAAIVAGGRRRIDVGLANDVHFLNVASIGLSVDIASHQTAELKEQWGTLSYPIATLKGLGRAEKFAATISCDGQRHEVNAYQIAVGNGIHYGAGLVIAEDAAIDDGLLDGYALENNTLADLVSVAPLLWSGTLSNHRHDDVRVFRGKAMTVETAEPMAVNTDGEVTTETPAHFSVLAGALDVFVAAAGGENQA